MSYFNFTRKLGHKLAKRMHGLLCAYIFLIFMILIFASMSRADTITVIEEVTTTETITEMVEQEVTTTQTITEIVDQEVEVEVTSEVQVEQVTPDVQESITLDALSNWTTSGDASTNATQGSYCTSGEACTGHQGGTFSTGVDFEDLMTIQEINNGFDINYGVTVQSHGSNASLPLCSQTNGDCKDHFTVTLELTSGGSVVQTFEDTIVLDFGGTRDYTFSESIGTNTYTDLLGSFSLFGIDAGYHRGMYGPIFSDPYMNVVYDQIEMITQQVTNIVTETIQVAVEREIEVIETILVPVEREIEVITFIETEIEIPDVNEMDGDTNPLEVAELEVLELDEPMTLEPDTSFTVEITDSDLGTVVESFEVQVEVAETGDMATISIEDIGGEIEVIEIEVEPQVAEVEVEVAAEIEMEVETEMEVAETSSQPEAEVEVAETGEIESETKVEVAETKTKSTTQKQVAKSQQIKKQVASAVAKRIMSSIANSYDSASQATQLALMNVIGSPKYSAVSLSDQYNTDWYESTDIYMQEGLSDPYSDAFMDAQGMQMDNLINSQY